MTTETTTPETTTPEPESAPEVVRPRRVTLAFEELPDGRFLIMTEASASPEDLLYLAGLFRDHGGEINGKVQGFYLDRMLRELRSARAADVAASEGAE